MYRWVYREGSFQRWRPRLMMSVFDPDFSLSHFEIIGKRPICGQVLVRTPTIAFGVVASGSLGSGRRPQEMPTSAALPIPR
jgi:hypothetical protein